MDPYDLTTKGDNEYFFHPVSDGCLNFKVTTFNGVHILLTTTPDETSPKTEVVIGGDGNKICAIRRDGIKPGNVVIDTKDIVSDDEYRGFWVRWNENKISVGKEGGLTPLLSWVDPNPFQINYFGIHTQWSKSVGTWQIEGHDEISTPIGGVYRFFPAICGELEFEYYGPSECRIALTKDNAETDPMYEIILNAWENKTSVIKQRKPQSEVTDFRSTEIYEKVLVETQKIINSEEFNKFSIRWNEESIMVNSGTKHGPIVMEWVDDDRIPISHFGVRTVCGAPGDWIIPSYNELDKDLKTDGTLEYIFNPVFEGGICFRVKAGHDVHIALTASQTLCNPMIEVLIGGGRNKYSAIRRDNEIPDKVKIITENFLSEDEFRGFWICWKNGLINVGKENEIEPFLSWNDPEPFIIKHFAVCTKNGATGSWLFKGHDEIITEEDIKYNYFPVHAENVKSDDEGDQSKPSEGSFHFQIKANNDAHIALTTDPSVSIPMIEVFIGGWRNTKSAIRRDNNKELTVFKVDTENILSGAEFRGFWINWKDGLITAGKEGETEPFLIWNDPEPFPINYFAICTGYEATGTWKIQGLEEITTGKDLVYQFFPINLKTLKLEEKDEIIPESATEGIIDFKVKAYSDVRIALTADPNFSNPMTEVFIGRQHNKYSAIRRDNKKSYIVEVATDDFLSGDEFKGFWIRWKGGLVHIGKENDTEPFFIWNDPEPFPIKYYAVTTANGIKGTWQINGRDEIITGGDLKYQYFPALCGRLEFDFKGNSECRVALTSDNSPTDPMYEIIIGGWGNKLSAIRRNDLRSIKAFRRMQNDKQFKKYFICWSGKKVEVRLGGLYGRVLTKFINEEPFQITHFGLRTVGGTIGNWKIISPPIKKL